MPKIALNFKYESGKGGEEASEANNNFEFTRHVEVDPKDLTAFYYAIRTFFRRNVTEEEKDQLLDVIKDKNAVTKIKRRKNVSLEEILDKSFFVEGVDRVGTNKYQVLWGL